MLFLFPANRLQSFYQESNRQRQGCLMTASHSPGVLRATHRHHHVEAPYHWAEMKDDQLPRFIELAVFDLGEMKSFADFLINKENPTH